MCKKVLILFLLFITFSVSADVPRNINYQGRLTDGGGLGLTGIYNLTFRIYDNSVAGTLLWNSGSQPVTVTEGNFTYQLGSVVLLSPSIFSDTNRYLGITVAGDPEITPRTKLTTAPYAFHALTADTAKSGGGWVDDGSIVRLADLSDYVAIGKNYQINSNEILGLHKNTTSWGGMNINVSTTTGLPFYSYSTNDTYGAYHYYNGRSKSWQLYNNGEDRLIVDSFGYLGINSYSSIAQLSVHAADTMAGYFTGDYDGANATVLYAEYSGPNTSNWDATAIRGIANQNISSNFGIGGHFEGGYIGSRSTGYSYGAIGTGYDSNGSTVGVRGSTVSTNIGTAYGVYASGNGNTDADIYGLYAEAFGTTSGVKYAGYFAGNVGIIGTLSKGGGAFKIDHPLDPENKILYHSFVESPDMMNIYNGNITLDNNGAATIKLPEYFDALNRDYRYQLTSIGLPAPNLYVSSEIDDNTFTIAGGPPGGKVSWQVTGVRKDAWAEKNRIPVEVDKIDQNKGYYIHPEAINEDISKGIDYNNHTRKQVLTDKTRQKQ